MIEKKNFYINGKWVSPSKPNNFEVIDPSTEEPFAIISLGSIEDTDKAISAAKNACSISLLFENDSSNKLTKTSASVNDSKTTP